jgi:hypothetical protein
MRRLHLAITTLLLTLISCGRIENFNVSSEKIYSYEMNKIDAAQIELKKLKVDFETIINYFPISKRLIVIDSLPIKTSPDFEQFISELDIKAISVSGMFSNYSEKSLSLHPTFERIKDVVGRDNRIFYYYVYLPGNGSIEHHSYKEDTRKISSNFFLRIILNTL